MTTDGDGKSANSGDFELTKNNVVSFDLTQNGDKNHKRRRSDRNTDSLLSKASSIIRFRRTRDSLFKDNELFIDPTWDMILELFVARLQQVRISDSALCIASQIGIASARRWIKHLAAKQLIIIEADLDDDQRSFVTLTQKAVDQIETLLSAYP